MPSRSAGRRFRGRPGRVIVDSGTLEVRDLAIMSDGNVLRNGDLLRVIRPGGGLGLPLDWPAEQVLADVLDGFVSAESAFEDYGVVLDGDAVDMAASEVRRAGMVRPVQMFYCGRPYDAEDDRCD